MTHETIIRRGTDGALRAKTVIPFGYDRRELHINTYKSSRGGLSASAQAVEVDPDGRSYRFTLFADYNRTLVADPAMRCTEKNLRMIHDRALALADEALAEAKAKHPPVTTKEPA